MNRPLLLWVCMAGFAMLAGCNETERPPEPLPDVIVKNYQWPLSTEGSPYLIDIDSNGRADFTLTVTLDQQPQGIDKAIFRLKGEIFGQYTSAIYAPLWELNEQERCNVFYSSVLTATNFTIGDSVGNHLDLQWRYTGDFHHGQSCLAPGCSCPDNASDIVYVPIATGDIGYIGVRFIIRNRKHFAWLELEHLPGVPQQYVLRRVAYNRFPEAAITIP